MKQIRGFWLPDGEEHLVPFVQNGPVFASGPTYQLHKLLKCFPHIKTFRHAVDIGAHCGLWSRPLAACFSRVTAFEPMATHRECWSRNTATCRAERHLFPFALGAEAGQVAFASDPKSSGDTVVKEGGALPAEMLTLDSFELPTVDFVKIDCEGYELFVLQGGEKTIKRDKPCIIVEQKPGKAQAYGIGERDACKLLESWGAARVFEISGDFGYTWK